MKSNTVVLSAILGLFALISPSLAQGRLDRPSFFQDGQRLMEQEIQRLQKTPEQTPQTEIEHPSQLLTIDSGQLSWQKSIFREGGFSVWIPEGTQSQEMVSIDTVAGNLSFEVFASHPPKSRFVAAYSDKIDESNLTNPQGLLDSVQQGIIAHTQFTLVSEQATSFDQYLGKELLMRDDDEIIAFRLALINQRVYVLAANQKETDTLSEDVTNFFDSFRLLK